MGENIFHCGIQWKKTCGVVGYNVEEFSVLYPTILLCCIVGYSAPHKVLLWCRIQRKKNSSIVEYNGKKFVSHPEIFLRFIHNGKKPLPLYPTMEENILCCIPQWKKNSSVISLNGKKPLPLYPTTAKKT